MDIDLSKIANRHPTISKLLGVRSMGGVCLARKRFKLAVGACMFLLVWGVFGVELIGHAAYAAQEPASQAKLKEASKSKPTIGDAAGAKVADAVNAPEPGKVKAVAKPKTKSKEPEPRVMVSVDDIVAAFECSRDSRKCGNQDGSGNTEIASNPQNSSNANSPESATRPPFAQSMVQHGYDFDVSETTYTKIE